MDKFPLGGGFIYQHGGYKAFNISDPKPRNIHKASVRDRLLHHAVYRILYPFFDKTFISDSYSCRDDKGSHKAISNFKKYALVFSLLLIIACAYFNFPTLLDSLKNFAKTFLPNSTKDSAPSANLYSHLARVFFSYNIVLYLIFGLTGIFWLFKNTKKNWPRLEYIPLLITFPAFFYLLSPQISLDDPWLLRRFVFAVFPVLIFYSIYLLDRFFYHKIFLHIILVALIFGNFVISWRFLPVSENKGLLPQIEKISQKFGPEDLVLVDRMATGSGFSLMSEPMASLFGKNAVYFFNADDLKLIDRAKYKNIYLAVPAEDGKKWYTGVEKLPAGFSVITNNFLEPSEKKWGLAINTEFEGAIIFWKVK